MDIVSEVHAISSGSGWFIEDMTAQKPEDLKHVACFALVSAIDPAHPTLGSSKLVLPLAGEMIGEELVGKDVALFGTAIHENVARTVWDWLEGG
jgi:hypothetical protein